jgi:hypothetical protein
MADNRKMPRTLLAEGVDDAVLGEDSDWSDEDDVQATKAAVSDASDASPKRKDPIPSTRDLFGASSSSEDEAGDSVQAKKPTKMTTADLFGDDSSDLDDGEDVMDLGALDDANSSQQQLDEEEGYTSYHIFICNKFKHVSQRRAGAGTISIASETHWNGLAASTSSCGRRRLRCQNAQFYEPQSEAF